MISHNKVNVQAELAYETDNHTVSYKHRTGRATSYKLNNGGCTIIPYPAVGVKHIWQVYVTSELKVKLFCFFTYRRHNMNFHSCEKQIDSKLNKTN